jgi:hypothetical protein
VTQLSSARRSNPPSEFGMTEASMSRKPHVDRSPEEKWQTIQEGYLKRKRLGDCGGWRRRKLRDDFGCRTLVVFKGAGLESTKFE